MSETTTTPLDSFSAPARMWPGIPLAGNPLKGIGDRHPPLTEHTDTSIQSFAGTVFYDGECPFCTALARRFAGVLCRAGFSFEALQTAGQDLRLARALGIVPGADFDSMRVVSHRGRVLSGADGVVHLARRIWWARPLTWLSGAPLGMAMLRGGYHWVARHRGCVGHVCNVVEDTPSHRVRLPFRWPTLAPPVLLLAVVLPLALVGLSGLPPWVSMWMIAIALFLGFKVLTWHRARTTTTPWRSFAYMFTWVGMDAEAFLDKQPPQSKPRPAEWGQAALRFAVGLGLLGLAVPAVAVESTYLAAWVGLVGLILVLHFGLFHILALAWQVAGVAVRPIMQRPLAAQSLGEFWGSRWNSGFRQLSHDLVFEPLLRRVGPAAATLTAFAASGLVHELVISVPASGGYGLPTAYFLLQGLAVVAERTQVGTRLGLRRGLRGRTFAWMIEWRSPRTMVWE